jgi:hypothetical protein
MMRIHSFLNPIYSFWFFSLPLLALLAMISVILRRKLSKGKLSKGKLSNRKPFWHTTGKPSTEHEKKGNGSR